MELLRHTYYINLAHRTDRRERIEHQLEKLGVNAQRFDAIAHEIGAIGCFASHIRCIEMALENNYPQICIIEDDADFTKPNVFIQQLEKFYNSDLEWNVLLLAGNVARSKPIANRDYCHRALSVQTTCAYVVKRDYYETLLENMREGYARICQDPSMKYYFAIDIHWKLLQRKDLWYILAPLTINQYPDYSDVEKREVNYTHSMITEL